MLGMRLRYGADLRRQGGRAAVRQARISGSNGVFLAHQEARGPVRAPGKKVGTLSVKLERKTSRYDYASIEVELRLDVHAGTFHAEYEGAWYDARTKDELRTTGATPRAPTPRSSCCVVHRTQPRRLPRARPDGERAVCCAGQASDHPDGSK